MQKIAIITADKILEKSWCSIPLIDHDFQCFGGKKDIFFKISSGGIVLLDDAIDGFFPIEENHWKQFFKSNRVLVLSKNPNDQAARALLRAGAIGYAHALTNPQDMVTIIHSIAGGSIWLGRTLLQDLLNDIHERIPNKAREAWMQGLTPREVEVAKMAAMGESNATIAEALGIGERTARAHISSIFEKLKLQDRLMLALKVHGVKN